MADIVARLSARVFLGKELCRDPEWLRITVEYANNVAAAAAAIRKYPKVLRPVVHWFIPEAKTLRQQLAAASRIIQREVDKRESADWKSHDGGTFADAIQWTNEVYGAVKPDHTLVQMGLAFASLHTTADFLTQVIYDLCKHRKLMKRLRKEVILVVKEAGGLDRNAISKLKLMDSVLKESQRLKPSSICKTLFFFFRQVGYEGQY
ncbi:hypothetical protein VTN31DRAFT_5366 [Thermomyces dupontii]|uniref:uncharacterized protein n=1 Tax=Talaromyces thermophilus TaxID=28565 RepID=UPI003743735F